MAPPIGDLCMEGGKIVIDVIDNGGQWTHRPVENVGI